MYSDADVLLKEKYGGEKSAAFFADAARLEAGEPLAYVIGHIPFLNTTIYLDSHPLIPRPETEFWVERAITEIKRQLHSGSKPPEDRPRENPRAVLGEPETPSDQGLPLVRVLDLCAGSGCIGVAVAKEVPAAHVTFAELDSAHLSTITKNLEKNSIIDDREKYRVVQSDLFKNITGTYDFILSNPPYIDPALDRVELSVRKFEPAVALYGGKDGLAIIERIFEGARAKLAPHGQLWLEHEPEQTTQLEELAQKYGLTATTHTDQYNVPRYSIITVAQ